MDIHTHPSKSRAVSSKPPAVPHEVFFIHAVTRLAPRASRDGSLQLQRLACCAKKNGARRMPVRAAGGSQN
jgi:hypothetical protein